MRTWVIVRHFHGIYNSKLYGIAYTEMLGLARSTNGLIAMGALRKDLIRCNPAANATFKHHASKIYGIACTDMLEEATSATDFIAEVTPS